MEIKCGTRTFNCTSKDLILDNGACYPLITRAYFKDFSYYTPIISKKLFKKLLKEGKIKMSKKKYKTNYPIPIDYDLYEFVESEVNNG